MQEHKMAPSTFHKAPWTFEKLIFPRLGKRPINTILAPDLLGTLKRIEVRGTHETAHRAKQRCGQIFRYAIATGRAERDITADLHGALAPVVSTNRAALTNPAHVAELLCAIDAYHGSPTTAYALKLASRTFLRPGAVSTNSHRIPSDVQRRATYVRDRRRTATLRDAQALRPRRSTLVPATSIRLCKAGVMDAAIDNSASE